MGRLVVVVVLTFAVIGGAGLGLILAWAPVSSPGKLVAFIATMFAVTGATVARVLCGALSAKCRSEVKRDG
jgi:hypothetical protein